MSNTATPAEREVDIREREQADEAVRLAVMALGDVPTAVGGTLVPAAIDLLGREGGPEDAVRWAQLARELVRWVAIDAAVACDAADAADTPEHGAEYRRVWERLASVNRARVVLGYAASALAAVGKPPADDSASPWEDAHRGHRAADCLERARRAFCAGQA